MEEDPAEGIIEKALLMILNYKIDVSLLRLQRLKVRQISNNAGHINLTSRNFYKFLELKCFVAARDGKPHGMSKIRLWRNGIMV
jgi:hypothetical protein